MSDLSQMDRVVRLLAERGVRIKIDACGCCDSPWVKIEIDGELLVHDPEGVDGCADAATVDMFV